MWQRQILTGLACASLCLPLWTTQAVAQPNVQNLPKLDLKSLKKEEPRKFKGPAPKVFKDQQGRAMITRPVFSSTESGYIHEYGAFAIGDYSHGMFTLTLPFIGTRFFNVPLEYYARYNAPFIGPGEIYTTTIYPTPDRPVTRYFFFGRQSQPGNRRWVIYYNEAGMPTYQTQARHYEGVSGGPGPGPGPGPMPTMP